MGNRVTGALRVVLAMLTLVFFVIGAPMVVFSGLAGEPIENLNTAVRGIGLLLIAVFISIIGVAGDR